MSTSQRVWGWIVFILSIAAYAPIAIGGWQHPSEINVAAYSIWLIISGMMLYSSRSQGFVGWRLPLGFLVGNAFLLVLGLTRGGYTFNLGPAETTALYGVIGTISLWIATGTATRRWKPRILFLGGITADILSFYPQIKQYLLPHEPPTSFMLIGWCIWILAALINVMLVEKLFGKLMMNYSTYEQLHKRPKSAWFILEESLFSLENGVLMIVTVIVMTR